MIPHFFMSKTKFNLSSLQHAILKSVSVNTTGSYRNIRRAKILLCLHQQDNISVVSGLQNCSWIVVSRCKTHWESHSVALSAIEAKVVSKTLPKHELYLGVCRALSDGVRSGCPSKFSAETYCAILAVALELPTKSGHQITHWSLSALKLEIEKRGIVRSISISQLGSFLKSKRCETA